MLNLNICTDDGTPITRETRVEVATGLRQVADYLESEAYEATYATHPILDKNGRDIGGWYVSNLVPE